MIATGVRTDPAVTAELRDVATIPQLLERALRRWPDRPAIRSVPDDRSLTYAELGAQVRATAAALAAHGVGPGDRVAVMMANRIEYPLVWLACAQLGAAVVPINRAYRRLDAGFVVAHSGATLAVADAEAAEILTEVQRDHGHLRRIVDVDAGALHAAGHGAAPDATRVTGETTVNIQYTSGTTGRPKGCVLSHTYWLTLARKNVLETPRLGPEDVLLTAQPFSYMDPVWNLASALGAGASLVVLDRFHPSTFWSSVAEHGATFFYCLGVMPTLMMKMAPHPAERDHRVRVIACSGIPRDLHATLEERFGVPWLETYGMTEIGNAAAMRLEDHDQRVGTGAVGRATSSRELRVVDEDDRPLPRGAVGQLVVRGVGLMDGYLDDPEATREAFRNGWFHTGDRARIDEDGYVYFEGRDKDMIRRSGENISAVEVEEALLQHPAVRMVACVPVPDEIRGEEAKAYVVARPGTDTRRLLEEELPAHCAGLVAGFKVPRYWEARPSLPLTLSEKVAKGALLKETDDLRAGSWDRVERRWR